MKIDISQEILGVDDKPLTYTDTGMPFTLKTVAIEALLFPKGRRNPQTGAIEEPEDTFEEKMVKYRIYEKLKDAKEVKGEGIIIDLSSEEISQIKKLVAEIKSQLIVGQINDLLEKKERK